MGPDYSETLWWYPLSRPYDLLLEYVILIRARYGLQARQSRTPAATEVDVGSPKEKPRPSSDGI